MCFQWFKPYFFTSKNTYSAVCVKFEAILRHCVKFAKLSQIPFTVDEILEKYFSMSQTHIFMKYYLLLICVKFGTISKHPTLTCHLLTNTGAAGKH